MKCELGVSKLNTHLGWKRKFKLPQELKKSGEESDGAFPAFWQTLLSLPIKGSIRYVPWITREWITGEFISFIFGKQLFVFLGSPIYVFS